MKIGLYLVAAAALAALFGLGCAPRYPNDTEHQVESRDCVGCHFYGEAVSPPESHWDGEGNVSLHYELCAGCHRAK